MLLDSARQLKAALVEQVLAPLARPAHVRALGVAARPVESLGGVPATLALGIAPHGIRSFALAVRVQQRALEGGPEVQAIRRRARGEVDVRYVGRVAKWAVPWHQRRNRPLRMGGSIGHYQITAGTLGCFVRDRAGAVFILSNNHVLADEGRAREGDRILQAGRFDGGRDPEDAVAQLRRWVELKRDAPNEVDAAVAVVRDDVRYNHRNLTGIGRLAGLAGELVDEGTAVAKVGRTTGVTRGRVTAFELDHVVVAFDIGNLRFDGQIEIEGEGAEAFSQGGDSGSLVVNADRRAVALLFAGSDAGGANGQGLTYANPLPKVLEALDVDLLY